MCESVRLIIGRAGLPMALPPGFQHLLARPQFLISPRHFSRRSRRRVNRPEVGGRCVEPRGEARRTGVTARVHAAAASSSISGRAIPLFSAISLRWAKRERGMPIFRQLWTVDVGASIIVATALVPPSASII